MFSDLGMQNKLPDLVVVIAIIIIATVLSLYIAGAGAPFTFDDDPTLRGNQLAQLDPATFDHWRVASLSSDSGSLHRPVSMLSFYINFALSGGYTPFSLKGVNAGIHCAIGILLYFLCYKILNFLSGLSTRATTNNEVGASLAASIAAGFWLLHPLHVSTVLYSVQRMAQLSTLFVVIGLLVFVHFRERWSRQGASAAEVAAGVLWVMLATWFAVFSKENGVLLLWLIPVVEVSVFRGQWAGKYNRLVDGLGWAAFAAPLLVIAAIFIFAPDMFFQGYSARNFTMEERVLTQLRLLWRYAGWIAWPNVFDMGFQHDDIPLSRGLLQPFTTIIAFFAWLMAITAAIAFRSRYPLFSFAVLFFLVGHSLESGFLALEMVFEHRNYLPSIGVCLALGALFSHCLCLCKDNQRRSVISFFTMVLFTLLAMRIHTWSDDFRLAQSDVARHPGSVRSQYFYANALVRRYTNRQLIGLSEEQAKEALALGRHHFELMHLLDRNDIAALTMLFYMDNRFFPELADTTDWMSPLVQAFEGRVLKSSDRNSLAVLAECLAEAECAGSEQDAKRIISVLQSNASGGLDVAIFKYHYLQGSGADPAVVAGALQDLIDLRPGAYQFYPLLLSELDVMSDSQGLLSTLLRWIEVDPGRRYLPLRKALFSSSSHP